MQSFLFLSCLQPIKSLVSGNALHYLAVPSTNVDCLQKKSTSLWLANKMCFCQLEQVVEKSLISWLDGSSKCIIDDDVCFIWFIHSNGINSKLCSTCIHNNLKCYCRCFAIL